jgi:hypothetical protein
MNYAIKRVQDLLKDPDDPEYEVTDDADV